jgi:hypothetical protein
LRKDLQTFKNTPLTTIGVKIKMMTGDDYHSSQRRAVLWASNFELGEPNNDDCDHDGWDRLVGDFSYEGAGVCDGYKAFLTWDRSCAVFRHSCSEHVETSEMLRYEENSYLTRT